MTANEFYKNKNILGDMSPLRISDGIPMNGQQRIEHLMIEFAKYHVQKALEEASVKSFVDMKKGLEYYFEDYVEGVNKNSILNAYPLDNVR